MADIRHLENRQIAISQRTSSPAIADRPRDFACLSVWWTVAVVVRIQPVIDTIARFVQNRDFCLPNPPAFDAQGVLVPVGILP